MKQTKIWSSIFTYAVIFVLMICSVYAAQSVVDLGTAGDFVILSKSGISATGTTSVTGDIGVSPIGSTAITGFGLILDSTTTYSTSSLVTGKVYAANYAAPTPTKMTTAVSDMETAYTDAAGRTETSIITELGSGDISGMTLSPGLYKWGSGVLIASDVTLSGSGVYIFQIGQGLTLSSGAKILLSDGAQVSKIFWQVAGKTTLGTTSQFKGIILCKTLIEIQNGASLNGRALAQTAVTLDANAVSASGGGGIIPDTTPPVITLIGTNPIDVTKNTAYTEAGATAHDNKDGDVSVNTSGAVNTAIIETYTITYTATDAAGNTATKTRTVNVVEAPTPVLTTITLTPTSPTIIIGSARQLNAVGLDQFGSPIAVTIIYNSSNSSVATVNAASGLVTAIAPGHAIITAASGTVSATSAITVETVAFDTEKPIITSFTLSDTSVNLRHDITGICIVTDNLDTNIVGVITGIDTTTVGTKTATCTATDSAGNIATANETYTVKRASSGGGGSSGGSGSSSSIGSTWPCTEWSACSSAGIQTKTCTQPDSTTTSIEKRTCTPVKTTTPTYTGTGTSSQTTTSSQNQITPTAPQANEDNNEVTSATGNLITGGAISQSGFSFSWWWLIALVLLITIALFIGAYEHSRNRKIASEKLSAKNRHRRISPNAA